MCGRINRRQVLLGLPATALGLLMEPTTLHAQQYRLLCSWSGGGDFGQGLGPPAPLAMQQVQAITQAIGYRVPLGVYIGYVPNASATIIGGGPAIVYNPDFLQGLFNCNQPAGMTVLAHEVGHHANLDTTWAGQYRHPWQRELGADWVSGLAMRRLGANLDATLSGIHCSFGPFSPGSMTHPDSQLRIQAVRDGWLTG
jgi:hypothetical protein